MMWNNNGRVITLQYRLLYREKKLSICIILKDEIWSGKTIEELYDIIFLYCLINKNDFCIERKDYQLTKVMIYNVLLGEWIINLRGR